MKMLIDLKVERYIEELHKSAIISYRDIIRRMDALKQKGYASCDREAIVGVIADWGLFHLLDMEDLV